MIGPLLTFDASETIIFAQTFRDRYPAYTRLVDASSRIAYVFTGEIINVGDTLRALGGQFKKEQIGPYGVYYDFRPPDYAYEEVDPSAWRLESNYNPQLLAHIVDRDVTSAWSSGRPQIPGMTLSVDLGRIYPRVGRLLLYTLQASDTPRGLRLEGSVDNNSWERIYEIPHYWGPFFWSGGRPFNLPDQGIVEMVFPPRPIRFLKITQTGNDERFYWTLNGLAVYQSYPEKKVFPALLGRRLSLPWNRPLTAPSTPSRPPPGSRPICPWVGKGPGRGRTPQVSRTLISAPVMGSAPSWIPPSWLKRTRLKISSRI